MFPSVCLTPCRWVLRVWHSLVLCSAALTLIQKKKKPKKKNTSIIWRLVSVVLALHPSLRPSPFDPPTSIEEINAIHYHHRQDETQGHREWTASHRFFWHIHHSCDEHDRQAHFSGWNKAGYDFGTGEAWSDAHANVLISFPGLYLDPTHVNVASRMPRHTQGALVSISHLNKSVFHEQIYSTITQRIITYSWIWRLKSLFTVRLLITTTNLIWLFSCEIIVLL